MASSKIIRATIIGAIALFLFDGAFQALPKFGIRAVERLETNDLTTSQFVEHADRMVYIAADKTVSFVASKPADYYNLTKFFILEFCSDLLIAMLFALLFAKINITALSDRLWLTFGFSLIAIFAIHFAYFNWWGFSIAYTLGVALKTALGWLFIAFIQNRFIYKIK